MDIVEAVEAAESYEPLLKEPMVGDDILADYAREVLLELLRLIPEMEEDKKLFNQQEYSLETGLRLKIDSPEKMELARKLLIKLTNRMVNIARQTQTGREMRLFRWKVFVEEVENKGVLEKEDRAVMEKHAEYVARAFEEFFLLDETFKQLGEAFENFSEKKSKLWLIEAQIEKRLDRLKQILSGFKKTGLVKT